MVRKKKRFLHRDMTAPEKIIGLVLFIALVMSMYFISPFSRVASITVDGNEDVSSETIVQHSGLVLNQSIFSVMLAQEKINQNITSRLSRVNQVITTVNHTNQVHLKVIEHPTIAYVEFNQDYYAVLANGTVIVDESRKYLASVPIVRWEGEMDTLEIAMKELAKTTDVIRRSISEITHKDTEYLLMTLYMNDGNQVKVSYTHFAEKMNYYLSMKSIIGDKKGVVDLTIGAYFTPYD